MLWLARLRKTCQRTLGETKRAQCVVLKIEKKMWEKWRPNNLLKSANRKLLKLKMNKAKKSVKVKWNFYERKIMLHHEAVLNASGMKNNF